MFNKLNRKLDKVIPEKRSKSADFKMHVKWFLSEENFRMTYNGLMSSKSDLEQSLRRLRSHNHRQHMEFMDYKLEVMRRESSDRHTELREYLRPLAVVQSTKEHIIEPWILQTQSSAALSVVPSAVRGAHDCIENEYQVTTQRSAESLWSLYLKDWSTHKYHLFFGTLRFGQADDQLAVKHKRRELESPGTQDNESALIKVRTTFEPKHWFSDTMITTDIAWRLTRNQCTPDFDWCFTPLVQSAERSRFEIQDIQSLTPSHQLLAIGNNAKYANAFEVGTHIEHV
ncbi:hypothetical protein ACLMJK_001871 [Lecanora helva]